MLSRRSLCPKAPQLYISCCHVLDDHNEHQVGMDQAGSGACRRRFAQVRLQRVRGSAAFNAAGLPGSGHVVGSASICAQAAPSSWWPRTPWPARSIILRLRCLLDRLGIHFEHRSQYEPSLVQSANCLLCLAAAGGTSEGLQQALAMAFLSDMSLPGGDDLLGASSGRECLFSVACCDPHPCIRAARGAVKKTEAEAMRRGGLQA